nr:Chain C, K92 knob domain [Bos taurus]
CPEGWSECGVAIYGYACGRWGCGHFLNSGPNISP